MAGRPKRSVLAGKSDKPQTCGTRKGRGVGWGGSANGGGNRPAEPNTAEKPVKMVGVKHDPFSAEWRDAQLANHYLRLADFAEDEENDKMLRMTAGERLSDRIEGKPVQKQEITGKDGGAIQTETVNWAALSTEELRAVERAYRAAMLTKDTGDAAELD